MGKPFKIENGVKQGDPLSPPLSRILFCAALEEIFRKLKWEKMGMKINAKYLNNLRFADDVVLILKDLKKLKKKNDFGITRRGPKSEINNKCC